MAHKPVVLVEARLLELTMNGVRPQDFAEIRQLVGSVYTKSVVDCLIEPLLSYIEQSYKVSLVALAALWDADSMVELGQFGSQTRDQAILGLKRLRNPPLANLWSPIPEKIFICSLCSLKTTIVAKKKVMGVTSYSCKKCLPT